MAQVSYFWTTSGTGDGSASGYTQDNITQIYRALFAGLSGADLSGVGSDYLNELAVSGTSSPVVVATGAALAYGFFFHSSASENVAVPTPSTSTRIDRIVLEVNWAAQTVRVARVAGSEGGAAPSLTQTAGTTWQMPLAQASITTGGAITLTDQRKWLSVVGDGSITTAKLADGAALAEILDDDGAGSLLDADLLDGVQGSGYSTTSHNHTFDSLTNVSMGAKATDDFVKWNGTNYVPAVPAAGTPADNSITMAKLADLATDSLIGRDAAGAGDPIAITLGASLAFTGSNSIQRAALTGDVTASAGSNATQIAANIIEYTDMRAQFANPIVVYGLGANQDFTTIVTADFDTLSLDYDGPNIISNDGAGIFTFSVACYIEVTVSGFVGHATGTTEAWCNVFIENGTSGGSYSAVGRTSRIFYIPGSNWNGFHVACVSSRGAGEKLRVRIERSAGTDSLRLSTDSAIIIKVIA